MITRSRPRRGFTLIELLIVIGIIVILATLGFMFVPNLDKNKGVPNATGQVAGWINLSKQQALRDHRAHGIRLVQNDPNNPTRCTALQYIEVPDPIAPRGIGITLELTTPNPNPDPTNPKSTATLRSGANPMNWDLGVEVGDYLELTGGPTALARITAIGGPAGATRSVLLLDRPIEGTEPPPPPPPNQQTYMTMTSGFRVIRGARPLVGEPMLQLHRDVYIDLTWCFPCPLLLNDPTTGLPVQSGSPPYGNLYTGFRAGAWGTTNTGTGPINNIDILFNSRGVGASSPSGQLIVCVRHIDRTTDMLLISISTRTGTITTHTWNDAPNADPYSGTRDGKTSGL